MSKLQELITEFCPDGVEYKSLSAIFRTRNGYTPSKGNLSFWENGIVPWFRMEDIRENGRILSKATQYVSRDAVKGELFPANSIIVATSATIGEHALITVPSLANQRFTYLMLKEEYANAFDIKFLFYYCFKLDEYCKACLNQGNFASVDMQKFAKFEFPIPPLHVQREIVQILDNFTELTIGLARKLSMELIARKKQYEFYRAKLMFFEERSDVVRRTFGELFDFQNGFAFKSTLFKDSGKAILRISNIQNNCIDTTNMVYYSDADYKENLSPYIVNPGDIIVAMSGATTGKIGVNTTGQKFYLNQRVGKFIPKEDMILSRYLYHLLIQRSEELYTISGGGAQPNLSSEKLKKLTALIPSLKKQAEIVTILDYFDTKYNDFTVGLPSEIEARQKQYKYYRDKLLTFKELKA